MSHFLKENLEIILVYVDDFIIIAKGMKQINQIKKILTDEYKMEDKGDLKFIIGLEVKRNRVKLH